MSQFRRKLLESYATNKLVYPGLIAAWSAKGKTNEDVDRNVLKDLTGNGHDITLNNFAYSGMSGYGGYATNFTNWAKQIATEVTHNKVIMNSITGVQNWINNTKYPLSNGLKIKVSGITDEKVFYRYSQNSDNLDSINMQLINGINECPSCVNCNFFSTTVKESCNIILELLPEYPDALVFDGVDDYHTPIKYSDLGFDENYTVIGVLTPLGESLTNRGAFVLSTNAIVGNIDFCRRFESRNTDAGGKRILCYVDTFPASKKISYTNNDVYISANNKGENGICFNISGNNYLKSSNFLAKIAFYSAYIFNRVLDEQEIKSFIRKHIDPEYLLPSEIPTPDVYYDFTNGDNSKGEANNVITDLSGNGNDAKAYNIAWAGMSGYGGYNLPIEKYIINGTFSEPIRQYGYDFKNGESIGKLRFNVSNLSEGTYFTIRIVGLDYGYRINKNGYWELKDITNNTGNTKTWEIVVTNYTYNNVTIEFLPEYEGALVLDGVDDYIALESFDSGFKTVFVVCKPFRLGKIIYDQRFMYSSGDGTCIYVASNTIAYYAKNQNGQTFINGKLNETTYVEDLVNRKQLITQNMSFDKSGKPFIGRNVDNNLFSEMALYKFLGFKEALTEEQIKAVINKYNLLDGVDNIDVN